MRKRPAALLAGVMLTAGLSAAAPAMASAAHPAAHTASHVHHRFSDKTLNLLADGSLCVVSRGQGAQAQVEPTSFGGCSNWHTVTVGTGGDFEMLNSAGHCLRSENTSPPVVEVGNGACNSSDNNSLWIFLGTDPSPTNVGKAEDLTSNGDFASAGTYAHQGGGYWRIGPA